MAGCITGRKYLGGTDRNEKSQGATKEPPQSPRSAHNSETTVHRSFRPTSYNTSPRR